MRWFNFQRFLRSVLGINNLHYSSLFRLTHQERTTLGRARIEGVSISPIKAIAPTVLPLVSRPCPDKSPPHSCSSSSGPCNSRASGQLELSVIDHDTGQPIAVRMHLKNSQGRPVKPPGVPSLGDHFVFYDKILLRLGNGSYEFLIERGTEYLEQRGQLRNREFCRR